MGDFAFAQLFLKPFDFGFLIGKRRSQRLRFSFYTVVSRHHPLDRTRQSAAFFALLDPFDLGFALTQLFEICRGLIVVVEILLILRGIFDVGLYFVHLLADFVQADGVAVHNQFVFLNLIARHRIDPFDLRHQTRFLLAEIGKVGDHFVGRRDPAEMLGNKAFTHRRIGIDGVGVGKIDGKQPLEGIDLQPQTVGNVCVDFGFPFGINDLFGKVGNDRGFGNVAAFVGVETANQRVFLFAERKLEFDLHGKRQVYRIVARTEQRKNDCLTHQRQIGVGQNDTTAGAIAEIVRFAAIGDALENKVDRFHRSPP